MSQDNPQVPGQGLAPVQPTQAQVQGRPKGRQPRPQTVQAMRELLVLGTDNPRMAEAVFPDFLRELYDVKRDHFNRELWLNVVGNLRRGLDIIDGEGRVVRTCPPMTGTVRTRVGPQQDASGNAQPSMSDIAEYAALQGRRHAPLEAQTFNQGIQHYKPEAAIDVVSLWRAILEDYGIIPKHGAIGNSGLTAESLLTDDGDPL